MCACALVYIYLCSSLSIEEEFAPTWVDYDFPFELVDFGAPVLCRDWSVLPADAPPSNRCDFELFVIAIYLWVVEGCKSFGE